MLKEFANKDLLKTHINKVSALLRESNNFRYVEINE